MNDPLTFAMLPSPRRLLRHVATAPMQAAANLYDPRANAEALQRAGMGRRLSQGVAGAASVADLFTPGPIVQGAVRGGAALVSAMRRRRAAPPPQFASDDNDPWMNRSGIPSPHMGFAGDDWLEQFIDDRAAGRHDGGDATMILAPASKPEARRRPQMAAQFIRSGGAPAPSDQMVRRVVRRPGGNPRMMAYLQRRMDALNRDQLKFDDDDDRFVRPPIRPARDLGRTPAEAASSLRVAGVGGTRANAAGPVPGSRGSMSVDPRTGRPRVGRTSSPDPSSGINDPLEGVDLSPEDLQRSPDAMARARQMLASRRQRMLNPPRMRGPMRDFELQQASADAMRAVRGGGSSPQHSAEVARRSGTPMVDFEPRRQLEPKPEDLDFKPMQRPTPQGRSMADMLAGIESARRRRLAPTPPRATQRELAGASLALRRPAMRRILGLRRARGISGRVGRLFKESAA